MRSLFVYCFTLRTSHKGHILRLEPASQPKNLRTEPQKLEWMTPGLIASPCTPLGSLHAPPDSIAGGEGAWAPSPRNLPPTRPFGLRASAFRASPRPHNVDFVPTPQVWQRKRMTYWGWKKRRSVPLWAMWLWEWLYLDVLVFLVISNRGGSVIRERIRPLPTHRWSSPISASNWAVTSVSSIHRQGPGRPVCLHTISAFDTIHFACVHCTARRGPLRFPRVRQWTGRSSRSFPALPSVWFYLCKYLTRDCRRIPLGDRRKVTRLNLPKTQSHRATQIPDICTDFCSNRSVHSTTIKHIDRLVYIL